MCKRLWMLHQGKMQEALEWVTVEINETMDGAIRDIWMQQKSTITLKYSHMWTTAHSQHYQNVRILFERWQTNQNLAYLIQMMEQDIVERS